jgi:hypothetical protein
MFNSHYGYNNQEAIQDLACPCLSFPRYIKHLSFDMLRPALSLSFYQNKLYDPFSFSF